MLKLRDLTVPDINKCKELCNFTDDELKCFILKTKDKSNVAVAKEMHISESQVSNLMRKIRSKIGRIL